MRNCMNEAKNNGYGRIEMRQVDGEMKCRNDQE